MQIKFSEDVDFYCFSVLIAVALEANEATRKKRSFKINNIRSMTAYGKALLETRKLEETLMRKSQAKLRPSTINVATWEGRSAEVLKTIGKMRVKRVAPQEMRFKNEGLKILRVQIRVH